MAWDFSTEPGFQKELDWIEEFTRQEIEPLDYVLPKPLRHPGSRPPDAYPAAPTRSPGESNYGHCTFDPNWGVRGMANFKWPS